MEKSWYSIFEMDEREQINFSMKRQILCVCIIATSQNNLCVYEETFIQNME